MDAEPPVAVVEASRPLGSTYLVELTVDGLVHTLDLGPGRDIRTFVAEAQRAMKAATGPTVLPLLHGGALVVNWPAVRALAVRQIGSAL